MPVADRAYFGLAMVEITGKGALRAVTAGTRRRSRPRRPTLASALKQAKKEGLAVSGATWAADGTVSLTFGESNSAQQGDLDKWIAKRHAH